MPLVLAIHSTRARTKVYDRVDGGFNVSTSNKGDDARPPSVYYYSPNRITADRHVLYVERLPNTV